MEDKDYECWIRNNLKDELEYNRILRSVIENKNEEFVQLYQTRDFSTSIIVRAKFFQSPLNLNDLTPENLKQDDGMFLVKRGCVVCNSKFKLVKIFNERCGYDHFVQYCCQNCCILIEEFTEFQSSN